MLLVTGMSESHCNRLREWRESQGLHQVDLAAMLDVEQSTISRLESGAHFPRRSLAERISEASKGALTVEDLVLGRYLSPAPSKAEPAKKPVTKRTHKRNQKRVRRSA